MHHLEDGWLELTLEEKQHLVKLEQPTIAAARSRQDILQNRLNMLIYRFLSPRKGSLEEQLNEYRLENPKAGDLNRWERRHEVSLTWKLLEQVDVYLSEYWRASAALDGRVKTRLTSARRIGSWGPVLTHVKAFRGRYPRFVTWDFSLIPFRATGTHPAPPTASRTRRAPGTRRSSTSSVYDEVASPFYST